MKLLILFLIIFNPTFASVHGHVVFEIGKSYYETYMIAFYACRNQGFETVRFINQTDLGADYICEGVKE